jgi:hypothetical protein
VDDHAGRVHDGLEQSSPESVDTSARIGDDGRLVDVPALGGHLTGGVDGLACARGQQVVGKAVERTQDAVDGGERATRVTHSVPA